MELHGLWALFGMWCGHKVFWLEQSQAIRLDSSHQLWAVEELGVVDTAGCPYNLRFSSRSLLAEA